MGKSYVGIMLSQSVHQQLRNGKLKHEHLRFYETACKNLKLKPCYFRLQDIHLKSMTVRAFVPSKRGYIQTNLQLPRVIHNRAIHTTPRAKKKLKKILRHGIFMFNTINRYSKLKIHRLLMNNPNIRPHLPGTRLATSKNVKTYLSRYPQIILKPDNSSIGKGVMLIEKKESTWYWIQRKKHSLKIRRFKNIHRLPAPLLHRLRAKRYVVQQRLPLATYQGNPFDLRVSVQKGENGHWKITGIAGKLAAKGKYVTNVAQGGTVHSLEELLKENPQLDASQVRSNVEQFSLEVATTLEKYLKHLADIGLDIGIDKHGYPMFIECNCRDLRYSFKEGRMPDAWANTYANPMRYAKYLLNKNHEPLAN